MKNFVYLAIFLILWMMVGAYLNLPTVETSTSTGECFRVVTKDNIEVQNGCKNLPKKYHHVYVR